MKNTRNHPGVFLLALLLAACAVCAAGAALGEEIEVVLPDGGHSLTVPAGMEYQAPSEEETDLKGIFLMPPDLEMLVFAYDAGSMTVQELAETMANAGLEAQVREIAGEQLLVFQDHDEADGAPCIGYSYISGGRMVEISFFYGSQAAMDLTAGIMETLHR